MCLRKTGFRERREHHPQDAGCRESSCGTAADDDAIPVQRGTDARTEIPTVPWVGVAGSIDAFACPVDGHTAAVPQSEHRASEANTTAGVTQPPVAVFVSPDANTFLGVPVHRQVVRIDR